MEAVKLGVAEEFNRLLHAGKLEAIKSDSVQAAEEQGRFRFFGRDTLATLATTQLSDGSVLRGELPDEAPLTAESSAQFVTAVEALDLRRLSAKLAE
jgi:hypothetical protein